MLPADLSCSTLTYELFCSSGTQKRRADGYPAHFKIFG